MASTVDRAPVTFLPSDGQRHWTGYQDRGPCLPGLSERGCGSEISNQFQFSAGASSQCGDTELISGQKSPLDTGLGLWSQVSLVLVCICCPSSLLTFQPAAMSK